MESEKKTYYECPGCGDPSHETKKEAIDCCPLDYKKRTVYLCGYCFEDEHSTKAEAEKCCSEIEDLK